FRNPNVLILDETTNDLDLPTLAVLEQFLTDYPGCILIVSHDRYFMDRLVDHLFVFEGDAVVRDFPGNYSEYRIWQKESLSIKA
ncbi:ABC transporter ATP-binding protein, partial [Staphylococcus aureus]